jgi:hypothetical protein
VRELVAIRAGELDIAGGRHDAAPRLERFAITVSSAHVFGTRAQRVPDALPIL